jgi:hypothetical protein
MDKCNVCDQTQKLQPHPFMPGALLCAEHQPKRAVEEVQGELLEIDENSVAVIAEAIPETPPIVKAVIVDREELFGLRAEGIVGIRGFVYFALRINGISSGLMDLDIAKFSEEWQISSLDCLSALASLSKKGIVVLDVKELSAQALTHKERIQNMEKALES